MPPLPATLSHPWGQTLPELGRALPLRPGLLWVRMPLPFALDHINLWVLDEAPQQPGWAVVDTGIAHEAIQAAWHALWQGPLAGRPLARVLVTHMHPDHVGNAQWLIEQFSAPEQPARLCMSATDHLAAQRACQTSSSTGGERAARFFMAHGLHQSEDLAKIRARGGYYAALVPAVPETYRRLMDGMHVPVGDRQWRCVAGHGHSPEHIALYDARDGLLISGDMLLPGISTNVSVHDHEPEADALGLFLASIERLRELPPDTLVLPSHGRPFLGVQTRIDQLQAHHAARLDEVRSACRQRPCSAADLLPVLFKRALDLHQTTFAMGESVAHLNHLWLRGELRRAQDASGVWRFSLG